MDNRASSLFAPVRGCKASSGLREFGFGHRISLLLVALVLIVIPHSASAQATATLNGVVRDSSGAVVPQATVTLHNSDTGTERESLTNDSGLYVFVSVPPGEYVLKVTKSGFTTATQAGLHGNFSPSRRVWVRSASHKIPEGHRPLQSDHSFFRQ